MRFEFLKTNLVLDNRDKPLVKTNKVLVLKFGKMKGQI